MIVLVYFLFDSGASEHLVRPDTPLLDGVPGRTKCSLAPESNKK